MDEEYEDDGWEHAGQCPTCGYDELDERYDEEAGETEYLCAHCGAGWIDDEQRT